MQTHRGAGKPIKNGSRIIGYVASKPTGPLGYYWAHELQENGNTRNIGGAGSQGRAIAMLREHDDRTTLPQQAWHVRTQNGSQCIVQAATEHQAWERARYAMKKWAEKAFDPVNARLADDGDPREATAAIINFGELK